MTDSSSEAIEARRQWYYIFKVHKEKCQPRILHPKKLLFKTEGKIKTFPDKQNP